MRGVDGGVSGVKRAVRAGLGGNGEQYGLYRRAVRSGFGGGECRGLGGQYRLDGGSERGGRGCRGVGEQQGLDSGGMGVSGFRRAEQFGFGGGVAANTPGWGVGVQESTLDAGHARGQVL